MRALIALGKFYIGRGILRGFAPTRNRLHHVEVGDVACEIIRDTRAIERAVSLTHRF